MAKDPKKKVVSKKDVSRRQREQRQKNLILGATLAVLILVAGVIIFGLLYELVFEGHSAVATVNGDKISLNDFRKEVRYQRYQSIQSYYSYYQLYSMFGSDLGSSFISGLQSIQNNLAEENKLSFGEQVLQQLIDNRLIAQYAAENGITVSQDELDQAIREGFGYYPNGTPTPEPTATPFSTATLSELQYSLVSPTPEATQTPVAEETAAGDEAQTDETTATPQAEMTAAPEEEATEEQTTATPTVESTAAPTGTPLPTATVYTEQLFEENQDNLLTAFDELGLNRDDLNRIFTEITLRDKVYEVITGDMPAQQEQVWARHILVDTQAKAEEVLQKLAAGEDWTTLAAEYSSDTSNKDSGGDLGWFGIGDMVAPFEEAAFSLGVGEISEPVQTDFGWHIIQVLGHEDRDISASALKEVKDKAFADWLDAQQEASDIETTDKWQEDIPVEPTIPPEYILDLSQS